MLLFLSRGLWGGGAGFGAWWWGREKRLFGIRDGIWIGSGIGGYRLAQAIGLEDWREGWVCTVTMMGVYQRR